MWTIYLYNIHESVQKSVKNYLDFESLNYRLKRNCQKSPWYKWNNISRVISCFFGKCQFSNIITWNVVIKNECLSDFLGNSKKLMRIGLWITMSNEKKDQHPISEYVQINFQLLIACRFSLSKRFLQRCTHIHQTLNTWPKQRAGTN